MCASVAVAGGRDEAVSEPCCRARVHRAAPAGPRTFGYSTGRGRSAQSLPASAPAAPFGNEPAATRARGVSAKGTAVQRRRGALSPGGEAYGRPVVSGAADACCARLGQRTPTGGGHPPGQGAHRRPRVRARGTGGEEGWGMQGVCGTVSKGERCPHLDSCTMLLGRTLRSTQTPPPSPSPPPSARLLSLPHPALTPTLSLPCPARRRVTRRPPLLAARQVPQGASPSRPEKATASHRIMRQASGGERTQRTTGVRFTGGDDSHFHSHSSSRMTQHRL